MALRLTAGDPRPLPRRRRAGKYDAWLDGAAWVLTPGDLPWARPWASVVNRLCCAAAWRRGLRLYWQPLEGKALAIQAIPHRLPAGEVVQQDNLRALREAADKGEGNSDPGLNALGLLPFTS